MFSNLLHVATTNYTLVCGCSKSHVLLGFFMANFNGKNGNILKMMIRIFIKTRLTCGNVRWWTSRIENRPIECVTTIRSVVCGWQLFGSDRAEASTHTQLFYWSPRSKPAWGERTKRQLEGREECFAWGEWAAWNDAAGSKHLPLASEVNTNGQRRKKSSWFLFSLGGRERACWKQWGPLEWMGLAAFASPNPN